MKLLTHRCTTLPFHFVTQCVKSWVLSRFMMPGVGEAAVAVILTRCYKVYETILKKNRRDGANKAVLNF